MKRTYTLKRRAEQQAETRQRIVEAAVNLHSTVGPAATTFSMVAERAGVQRHTLYAHFPDERSLFLACSGMTMERDPLPDPESWRSILDREERVRMGLEEVYGWYERNASLAKCVLRDVEDHALTAEIFDMQMRPRLAAYPEILGAGLSLEQQPLLQLALSFFTWRTLVDAGLSSQSAVDAMVRAIFSAALRGAPAVTALMAIKEA